MGICEDKKASAVDRNDGLVQNRDNECSPVAFFLLRVHLLRFPGQPFAAHEIRKGWL
jgi:hypothetical protein